MNLYQADVPVIGQSISSKNLVTLARAFNSRILNGAGDAHWRIPYYIYSAYFQKPRLDNGVQYSPESEFFDFYQFVNPSSGDTWPIAGPQNPEGINLQTNPLNKFIFGMDYREKQDGYWIYEREDVKIGKARINLEGLDNFRGATFPFCTTVGSTQETADYSAFGIATNAFSNAYINGNSINPAGHSFGGYYGKNPFVTKSAGCGTDETTGYDYPMSSSTYYKIDSNENFTKDGFCEEGIGTNFNSNYLINSSSGNFDSGSLLIGNVSGDKITYEAYLKSKYHRRQNLSTVFFGREVKNHIPRLLYNYITYAQGFDFDWFFNHQYAYAPEIGQFESLELNYSDAQLTKLQSIKNLRIGRKRVTFYSNPLDAESSGLLLIDSSTQNAIPSIKADAVIYRKQIDSSQTPVQVTGTDNILDYLYSLGIVQSKINAGNLYEKIDTFRLIIPAWDANPIYSQFTLQNIEVRAKRLKSFKVSTFIRKYSSSEKAYVEENVFTYKREESNTIKSAALKEFYAGFGYDVSFLVENIEVDKIEESFSVTGDTFTCANHGLLVGDAVKFISISNGSGINIGNGSVFYAYDVIEVNGNNFKVSTSPTESPISATIPSSGVFYALGYLTLEPVFLLSYKPKIQDAYALIRTCTYLNKGESNFDDLHHPLKSAYKITDDLKKYGFVTNNSTSDTGGEVILNISDPAINTNPVFEASRRLSLLTRILKPDNFVGIVNSKTLEFSRYARQNLSSLKLLESSGDILFQTTTVNNRLPLDNYSILYPTSTSDYFVDGTIPYLNAAANLVSLFGVNSGEDNRGYSSCRYFEITSDNEKTINSPIKINGQDLDKVASYQNNILKKYDPSSRRVDATELFINYDAIVVKNFSNSTAEYYYYRFEDKNGVNFTNGARKFDLITGNPETYVNIPIDTDNNSVSIGEIGKNETWQIYIFTRSGLSLSTFSQTQIAKNGNQFYFINNQNEYIENKNSLNLLLGYNYISNATQYLSSKYGFSPESFSNITVPVDKLIEQERLLYLYDSSAGFAKNFISNYNSPSSPVFISKDKQEYVEFTLELNGTLKDLFNTIHDNFSNAGIYIKTFQNGNKILKTFNSDQGGDSEDASWEKPFANRANLTLQEYNELLSGYQICFSYLDSTKTNGKRIQDRIQNGEIEIADRIDNLKYQILVYGADNHLDSSYSESVDSYISLPPLEVGQTLKARLPINLFDYKKYPNNPDSTFYKTETFSISASNNVFTASINAGLSNFNFLDNGVCLIFSTNQSGSSIITGFPNKYRIKNYDANAHTFNLEQDFTYKIISFTSTVFTSESEHSLNNGDIIFFTNTSGLNILSGFRYFVKNVSIDTFEISETSGGSTVTVSGSLDSGIILTFSKQSSTITGITNGSYDVRVFSEKLNPPIYLAAKTCNFCLQNPLLTSIERSGNLLSSKTSTLYTASPSFPKTRDIFQGIAPEILIADSGEEVSKLLLGETYTVGGTGNITHNGQIINAGSQFKASSNSYVANSSSVTVTKNNGIILKAPPKDFTNEWIMWMNFLPYNNVETSPLKESVYASTASPFIDRCHFRSKPLRKSVENEYLNLGQPISLYPVAPPSYRYIPLLGVTPNGLVFENVSSNDYKEQFYNSCKAFPKPYKIIEVKISPSDPNNVQVVLNRDIDGWANKENNDIGSQKSYRTDANGLMDWSNSKNQTRIRVGDSSITHDSGAAGFLNYSDNQMKGSYYPRFFFVKLIPEPNIDGNEINSDNDSPLLHSHIKQAELYLNAMREGFALEAGSSAGLSCGSLKGHLTSPDYTYEQLIFESTSSPDYYGNIWPTLSTFSSNYNVNPLRLDNPVGFGAIPQNGTYTEHYSTISKAINKLTRFRISVPLSYYGQTITYHQEKLNGDGESWAIKYIGGRNTVIGPSYLSDSTTTANQITSSIFNLRNNDGSLMSISANKSSGVRFTGTYGETTLTSSAGVWYYYISRTDAQIIVKQDDILIKNAYDGISSLVSTSSLSVPMSIQSSKSVSKWTNFGQTPSIDTCGVFAYPQGSGPESNTWKIEYTENINSEICSIQTSALIQSDSLEVYQPTTPNWGYRTCSFQVPGKSSIETWSDNGQEYGGFLWTATPSAGSTKTFTVHENGFKIINISLINGGESEQLFVV